MGHNHKEHNHGKHECRCHAKVKINTEGYDKCTTIKTDKDKKDGSCSSSKKDQDDEDSHKSTSGLEHFHDEYVHGHNHDHNKGYEHKHSHSHSHKIESLESISKAFYIGIGLNTIFTIIEFIVAYSINSLALLADASHNLSDVASLIISLIALKLGQKATNSLYTYGYKKASILASLINAIILVIISMNIGIEAINRLASSPKIIGIPIIITALIGVFINSTSAFLFFKGQKDDINLKGAFLHLLTDAIVSLGVVFSGIIIYFTNWNVIDPLLSIIIAIIVLISTLDLLKESVKLSLDGVPKNVDSEKVKEILLSNQMIAEFHDLHIWAIGSSINALTVHITLKENISITDSVEIKYKIKKALTEVNIMHATIEIDLANTCEYSC